MWYTAFEILVWMILAAVLGLAVGWLIWGWAGARRQQAALAAVPETDALAARIAALTEERNDLRATVRQLTADVDAHRLEASTASARVATLLKGGATVAVEAEPLAAVEAPAEPAPVASGAGPEPDDIEGLIEGIGPKIDAVLKAIGITTFRQIAQWDERAVAAIEAAIGTEMAFSGRIGREDWVGQAKRLHAEKYGEEL